MQLVHNYSLYRVQCTSTDNLANEVSEEMIDKPVDCYGCESEGGHVDRDALQEVGIVTQAHPAPTWLEGNSLHRVSPNTHRPMNVDKGVRGTETSRKTTRYGF